MKLKDVFEHTYSSEISIDVKSQTPFWGAGKGSSRKLGDEKKDPRYNWKTWKKWKKKLNKRKKNDKR